MSRVVEEFEYGNGFFSLFCRLAALLRIKNRAFGSVAKITVKCLQGLTQALDLRTLVKVNSDIVRTSLLTFFNNCADDLYAAVNELKVSVSRSKLSFQSYQKFIYYSEIEEYDVGLPIVVNSL